MRRVVTGQARGERQFKENGVPVTAHREPLFGINGTCARGTDAGIANAKTTTMATAAQREPPTDETAATGFAVFDENDRLLELNPALFEAAGTDPDGLAGKPLVAIIRLMLPDIVQFGGEKIKKTKAFVDKIATRWALSDGRPVEVEMRDGRWKLFTCHPRPGGGTAFISADITPFKSDQLTLRKNEELFRCLSETHPLPVWMVDQKTGEILYESRSASKLLGREWDPDTPQFIMDHYVRKSDRRELRRLIKENGGRIEDHEVLFKKSDGSEFWISATTRTNTFEGRDVLISGVLDMTDRKAREEELKGARETLHDAIESLSEGFALYDADERLVMCNSRYKEFHAKCADVIEPGVEWAHVIRTAMARGQYPESVGREEQWLSEHISERNQFGTLHEYELSDDRWMEAVTTSTREGGFVVSRADISERKHLARQEAERTEQLRFLIENHPTPVWMNDARSGEVIFESRVTRDLFGREALEKSPVFARDYFQRHEDYIEAGNVLHEKKALEDWELRLKKADGTPLWVICNAKWTVYEGREVVLAGIVDVTQRREREQHFKFLIENHPSPVALSDAETGQIIYESPAGAKLFGREWVPDRPLDAYTIYVRPEERTEMVRQARQNGAVQDFQTQLKRTDGTSFWASINARLSELEGRSVLLVNISDQSERIEREQELAHAREIMNDAIESLAEGFALYDGEDRLVMCNTRYKEMHPASAEYLVPGIKWLDFLRIGAERGQFLRSIGRVEEWLKDRAEDRKEFRQNHEFQHSDGRWFSVSNCPTRHGGSVVTRIDITERKRMEEEERERDALVRQVLDACPVPIQMTRLDGSLLYRSPASQRLFGKVDSSKSYYAGDDVRPRYLQDLLEHGSVENFEVRFLNADGEEFPGAVSSKLIDFQGEPVIVSNTVDLTERKAVDAQLAQQKEALHQSEKLSALGELLAGVAHELNNPLSIVVGQALLLRETAEDEAIADRATKIGNAADRCSRIVKTFLAMARQQPSELKQIDVNDVLESAMEVAGYGLRSSDVHVKLKLMGNLPRITADADQLSQVFINLVVNAQQALEEMDGDRRLTLSTGHNRETNELVVKVSDNGLGIPKDILPRIFEPFFTTKEVGSGTGIGLAYCHRIVERHNGTISATSEAGVGTTFVVRLPASNAKGDEIAARGEGSVVAQQKSILVIDDEPDVADLICEVLSTSGHRVTKADSGLAALEILGVDEFDVILSDLKMPNLDGPSLFEELKATEPALVQRLAFVTGDTMSPKAREFLKASGRPFIEKPIRPQELRELVNALTP